MSEAYADAAGSVAEEERGIPSLRQHSPTHDDLWNTEGTKGEVRQGDLSSARDASGDTHYGSDANLPDFLLQFEAGWVLASVLWEGVGLLEWEKNYGRGVELLVLLFATKFGSSAGFISPGQSASLCGSCSGGCRRDFAGKWIADINPCCGGCYRSPWILLVVGILRFMSRQACFQALDGLYLRGQQLIARHCFVSCAPTLLDDGRTMPGMTLASAWCHAS